MIINFNTLLKQFKILLITLNICAASKFHFNQPAKYRESLLEIIMPTCVIYENKEDLVQNTKTDNLLNIVKEK